jgi:hypothetical protein
VSASRAPVSGEAATFDADATLTKSLEDFASERLNHACYLVRRTNVREVALAVRDRD